MRNGDVILVVDDDPDVRDSLRALLELDGHRAVTASCAEEAIARSLPISPSASSSIS